MHILFVVDPFVFGHASEQEESWRILALSRSLMRLSSMQLSEKHRHTYCALRLIDGERGLNHLDIARSYPALAKHLTLNGDVFDEWTGAHFDQLAEEARHAASFRQHVEPEDDDPAVRIGKALQLAAHHGFVEAGKTSIAQDDPCVVVAAVPLIMLKPELESNHIDRDNNETEGCKTLIRYVEAHSSSSAFPAKLRVILLDTSDLVNTQITEEDAWLRGMRQALRPELAKTRSSLLTMEQILFSARLGVKLESLIDPAEAISDTNPDAQNLSVEGQASTISKDRAADMVSSTGVAKEMMVPNEEDGKENITSAVDAPVDAKILTAQSETRSSSPVFSSFAEVCCLPSNCGQAVSTCLWDLRSNADNNTFTISIDGNELVLPTLIRIEDEVALDECLSGNEHAQEVKFAAARDDRVAELFQRLLEEKKALSLVLEIAQAENVHQNGIEVRKTALSSHDAVDADIADDMERTEEHACRSEHEAVTSSAESCDEKAEVVAPPECGIVFQSEETGETLESNSRQIRIMRFQLVPASVGFASLYFVPDETENPVLSQEPSQVFADKEDLDAKTEGAAAGPSEKPSEVTEKDEEETGNEETDVPILTESALKQAESDRAPSPLVDKVEKKERSTIEDYNAMVAPLLAEIGSSSGKLKASMKLLEADETTLDIACILWLRFHQGGVDDSFKRRLNSILARVSISWRNAARFIAFLEGVVKAECTDEHVWEDLNARFVKDVNNTERGLDSLSRATSLPTLRRASSTVTISAPLLKKAQTTCSLPGRLMAVLDENEEEEEEGQSIEALQYSQHKSKGNGVAAVPLVTTCGTSTSSMLLAATTTTRKRVLNHFAEPLSNPDVHFRQVFLPPSSSSSASQASATAATFKKPMEASRSSVGQTAAPLKRARSIMETPTVVHATPHGGAAGATRFAKPSISKKLFETPTSERRSSMMLARVIGPSPTATANDDDKTSGTSSFRKRLPLHHY